MALASWEAWWLNGWGADTEAPHVEFGEATGTTAGEFLRIPYTSDEPLAAAELWLADDRHLELTVGLDELTVLLPPDAPAGAAGVWVADAAGNARLYPGVVVLQGIAPPPPPAPRPVPGRPWPAPRSRVRRRIRTRSRVEVRDRTSHRARAHYLSIAIARSRSFGGASSRPTPSRVEARSSDQIRGQTISDLSIAAVTSDTELRRRDSAEAEAALLLELV